MQFQMETEFFIITKKFMMKKHPSTTLIVPPDVECIDLHIL